MDGILEQLDCHQHVSFCVGEIPLIIWFPLLAIRLVLKHCSKLHPHEYTPWSHYCNKAKSAPCRGGLISSLRPGLLVSHGEKNLILAASLV